MPEYLAPGVYIEEKSFRSKSIEGVSTTTTGFVGPARFGSIDLPAELITSLGEFQRMFGSGRPLELADGSTLTNYLWHGVRAFFEEGGKRLYVARAFLADSESNPGVASKTLDSSPPGQVVELRARYPGSDGNMRVTFTINVGGNLFSLDGGTPKVASLRDRDVVLVRDETSPIASPPGTAGDFYVARRASNGTFTFENPTTSPPLGLDSVSDVRMVTVTIVVEMPDGPVYVYENLALDPLHQLEGAKDAVTARFEQDTTDPERNRALPLVIEAEGATGLTLLARLLVPDGTTDLTTGVKTLGSAPSARSFTVQLEDGNDGQRPEANEYAGTEDAVTNRKTGLKLLEDQEDISIVAAPGSTAGIQNGYADDGAAIIAALITHADRMRYRIAVLDSGDQQSIGDIRQLRARYDSTYAALYYPWVKVMDPITRQPINLPPSGFVSGIYARNDINRAVYKAPANEVVNLAIGLETVVNRAQQEALNPEGVNCFRFFEGRGFRLWGARTISSDPEWKYVNLRRYFCYLERSIDKGTQWAVFEPNGEQLWANIRRTIEDFLFNEFQMGALLGDKPEKAFFVKCDRSTMTQNDLDNGRLVCLIGVCPLRPAEFVIFRIGQWTGDRKV